jgi:tRNA 2-thiouridine synthesizing protein B
MLHIVNKSPLERSSLDSALRMAAANGGDTVLLIEDGVLAATKGSIGAHKIEKSGVKVVALLPDLQARGMEDRLMEGVQTVGYDGFVDLVAQNANVQSWL